MHVKKGMTSKIDAPAAVEQRQQQQLSTPTKHDPKPTPKASNATPKKINFVTPDKSGASQQQQQQQQQLTTPQTKSRLLDAVDQRTQLQLRLPAKTHEEFKNQLVHDVFGRDNKGRVPMEKVVMLIWQFRDDPSVVQFMAQFVGKVRLPRLV